MLALAIALAAAPHPIVDLVPTQPHEGPATTKTTFEVAGRVRRAGERQPVVEARVLVAPDGTDRKPGEVPRRRHVPVDDADPPWIRTATTGDDGRFALQGLPGARVRIIVLAPGYERYETIVELPTKRRVELFLEPSGTMPYRTVVEAPKREHPPARVATRELTPQELRTLPGTQGDSLRALPNLPGVARPPGGLGLLVVRGAAPNQSRVFYGEHALPYAFHSTAFSSVFPADAMASMEFMPGNAPSRFGDVTGGVVAITPARPRRDGFHGYGKLDLAGAGALVQGPLGKGSFLVGASRGWVDAVLAAAERVSPSLGSSVKPRYYDYQAIYHVPLRSGSDLEARVLGAGDSMERRIATRLGRTGPSDPQVAFGVRTQFHRADLSWSRRRGPWRFLASPSFRFERNSLIELGEELARRSDAVTSWRAEMARRIGRRGTITLGTDAEVSRYWTTTREDFTDSDSTFSQPGDAVRGRGLQSSLGLYLTGEAIFGDFTLWPGMRLSAFTIGADREAAIDPRLSGRWQVTDRLGWASGVGLYSQGVVLERDSPFNFLGALGDALSDTYVLPAAVRALEPDAGFRPEADDVRVARALQVSTAVDYAFDRAWTVEVGAFGSLRDNADGGEAMIGNALRADPNDPASWNDAYGLEVLLRRQAVGRWYGWVSYTLARVERRFLDPVDDSRRVLTDGFDQRHNLVLLASYALPRNWRVGGRFRLTSGSPYTDAVDRIEIPSSGVAAPLFEVPNTSRFPVFHQLDLRVDKLWYRKRTTFTAYLDVQNVYNRQNVEAYTYDEQYRGKTGSFGLPIFPTLGFRIDY